MNLDLAWLTALRDHLIEQNTITPPLVEVAGVPEARPFGLIQIGRHLEDPQENFGVLTLHLGDMDDPQWWHERITSQRLERNSDAKNSSTTQIFGAMMEIGGGTQWMFRYSAEMRLYYTLEGYDQYLAFCHATEAVHWTLRLLNEVRPRALGVGKIGGYLPRYQVADAFKPEERGGTDQWIWFCKLHFELYVHADRMAAGV